MNTLFLKQHLGLGDHFLCCGMVRVFAKQYERVFVPAKLHNVQTVQWMFSDLPNVSVVSVKDDDEMLRLAADCENTIGVGLFSRRGLQSVKWSEAFYIDAGLDPECRWGEFKLPNDEYQLLTGGHFFIHHDLARSYSIRTKECDPPLTGTAPYTPDPTVPMRHHIPMLRSASEIHVIDSCFLCLADSIETSAKRHVLHAYATAHDPYKKFGPPILRKNWEILR